MAEGMNLVLLLLLAILQVQLHPAKGETRIEVTVPTKSVTEGSILVLQCKIWEIQNGDKVEIVRTVDGQIDQISFRSNILESPVKQRAYLATRTFPDGSVIYFLTILDISTLDSGKYTCTVSRLLLNGRSAEIAYDSTDVQIFSFPDKSQPSCTSNPSNIVLIEGNMLELICATHKTIPIADLKWRLLSTYEYLQSSNSHLERENVVSRARVTLDMTHHNGIFRCEMTSEEFPDRMQSCEIGPISVKSSISTFNHDLSLTTSKPNEVTRFNAATPTDDCRNFCTSSSSDTIFYLTVSTAATCLLTIVFIITTCIMCFKHHNISSDVRQRQRQAPSPPSMTSDPVYVSLSRRNTNERVYMTLEDPNNPEGKVLLPKEVFDEFYNRTLSLRKT